MSTPPAHLLWIDIECTDTDVRAPHAAILEIGAIITRHDPQLTEVARASLLVRPPGGQAEHDIIWARMHPVVREMHSASGLWLEATTSDAAWRIDAADRALEQWVRETTGSPDPVPMAGSGVAHLDHPWVKALMPAVASRMTYWMVDIGQVRRMLQLAGRDDLVHLETDVEAKPHRGLADIAMHVEEARRYLQLIGQLPKVEAAQV